MKKLIFLAMLALFGLSGCAAAPYGVFDESGYYGYRNHPDDDEHHHHHHDRYDEDRGGDHGGGRDDD